MPSTATHPSPLTPVRPASTALLAFIRGFGQVDLQPAVATGVLFLAALWVADWTVGLFAVIGTAVSTATAAVLGVDRGAIAQGLHGYSGCLTGIALVTYLGNHPSTYLLAVLGAILCPLLGAALTTLLGPYGLTPLTAPFCLVSGVMVLGAPSFDRIWHGSPAALADTTARVDVLTWGDIRRAFFSNVSQIFLVQEWQVGLIMLLGLTFAGLRVVGFAALGSMVGILTAWALGAPNTLIAQGIYGYNAVLVAIAVGAVLLAGTVPNGLYALFGAAAATGLTAALTTLFKTFGGHTFTWPFILTTWVLMAAVPGLPRLRPARAPAPSGDPVAVPGPSPLPERHPR
ncbi:urea transporter [Embleya sp. NPDC059259]|uniref:urea transporter n=1 Tax=unclassified Embleya TaxID=2699296 RepID=UPI00369A9BFF